MTDPVERLAPDELWILFRRAAPPTKVKRRQNGRGWQASDRQTPAAITAGRNDAAIPHAHQ
ncbi:hypothetical protein ACFYNL_38210 [Streptomyces sp. NPDC007808]|uniref:hypothetical protein n=1 Tax=Streptomyces sp. NPDC007808 TaxID=3364779 RepID=UPI0036C06613